MALMLMTGHPVKTQFYQQISLQRIQKERSCAKSTCRRCGSAKLVVLLLDFVLMYCDNSVHMPPGEIMLECTLGILPP